MILAVAKMKKLEMIALLLLSTLVEISTSVSLYSIISNSEHVASDNRVPKKLQPVELMVDRTNQLGFTILDLHSILNKNNIAFSPCGLMSVLVALYEGTGGKSSIELKDALSFPRERDIVRIGVRDIHRRLRVS
jgi:serine protease inhibitor